MNKPKTCKCGGKRVGRLTICYKCFLAKQREARLKRLVREKASRARRRLIARRQAKTISHLNSYRYLHKKAWTAFSVAVRQDGMDSEGFNHCYTCGCRKHWKELHASHFWHRRLDFSRKNVKPCCPQCNTFKSGNLAPYAVKLTEELGIEGMKLLQFEANTKVYTCEELRKIIETYETN
jgi:hypothetical protein